MKNLLLQHSLEDGFNHINKKLVDFLREPGRHITEIVISNDVAKNSPGTAPKLKSSLPNSPKIKQASKAQKVSTKGRDIFDESATSSGLAKNTAATAKTKQTAITNTNELTKLQRQLRELPIVKVPYLPPMGTLSPSAGSQVYKVQPAASGRFASERKYTLVLDLDETLIHYVDKGEKDESYFLIRPYCGQFLREMAQYYEIVIFTAGVQEYADWVVDQLDPGKKLISHRLYR